MRELQPEMSDSRVAPSGQMLTRLLRFGAKHRITAPDIGQDGMRTSCRVPQRDRVLLARPAAIAIAGAGRQKPAKHAVLGVKDRQMLVRDRFNYAAARLAREFGDLRRVEVVRGSEAREAEIKILAGRERVGRVEAEVADELRMLTPSQRFQQSGRPDE